jgi:hypothetical protein
MANINNFLNNFSGGSRTDLFEVHIDIPDNLFRLQIVKSLLLKYANNTILQSVGLLDLNNITSIDSIAQKFNELNVNTLGLAGDQTFLNGVIQKAKDLLLGELGKLSAFNVRVPTMSVKSIQMKNKGKTINLPIGKQEDQTTTVSFYNDIDFFEKDLLELWQELIRSSYTVRGRLPKQAYGNITVYQFDQLENIIKTYRMIECFPLQIGDTTLDWGSENIQTFVGTFQFNYLETNTTNLI